MKILFALLFISNSYASSFKENVNYCKKLYGAGVTFERCIETIRIIRPKTTVMDACMRWGGSIKTLEHCLVNLKKRKAQEFFYELCQLSSDLNYYYHCIDESSALSKTYKTKKNFRLYADYCKAIYSEGDSLLLCIDTMLEKNVQASELKACYHWNSTISLLNRCIDGLQERKYDSFIYESCFGSENLNAFFSCTDNLISEKKKFASI